MNSFIILLIISNIAAFYVLLTHHIHMYQLNFYSPVEEKNRLRENRWPNFGRVFGFSLSIIFIMTNSFWLPYQITFAVAILLNALSAYLGWDKTAKIPLKYTKRVIRLFITTMLLYITLIIFSLLLFTDKTIINSIPIVPIIVQILPFLTVYIMMLADYINKPVEKHINNGFINDAKKILKEKKNLTVIGVTGSYGKTSVKNTLKTLLSGDYNVLITPGNFNTALGVVITIRQHLTPIHEIFICEMGAKNVGDIKEICDIVQPKYGIITSIGSAHLETFGSIQNTIKTKFELEDSVSQNGGTIFLNYDNEHIRDKKVTSKKVTYSINEKNTNFKAENIKVDENGSSFKLNLDGEAVKFETSLLGKHNILNIAGCVAIAKTLGISNETLVSRVKLLRPVEHRQQVLKRPFGLIIDDAYNSNPTGAKSALDTLALFDMTKIVVTPGMIELGDEFYQRNKEFGMQIADIADIVVLVGQKQTLPIQDGLKEKNYPKEKINIFSNMADALNFAINLNVNNKKAILIENDLPDNY